MAKNKTKWKVEIIILELIAVFALLGVVFLNKVESYNFKSDATYFVDGMDYAIPKGSVAKVDKKTGIITITRKNDYPLETQGLPAYFDMLPKMVLLEDLAYYKPSYGYASEYKLSRFTELEIDENGFVSISLNNQKNTETTGFLHDGENTYVFLEPMTLEFGTHHKSLPAFSYVRVAKGSFVEYYDYDTKEITFESFDGEVKAKDSHNVYTILLECDIVDCGSNQVMLFNYYDDYDLYFSEVKQ